MKPARASTIPVKATMATSVHRERLLAIFEKHRVSPGAPYDEQRFLEYFLNNPKGKRWLTSNSFRGLSRYNAFLRETEASFGVCFSNKDWDANYSLERFVERVAELENSPRSSRASLKSRMSARTGWAPLLLIEGFLLVMALKSVAYLWLAIPIVIAALYVAWWFIAIMFIDRRHNAHMLALLEEKKRN